MAIHDVPTQDRSPLRRADDNARRLCDRVAIIVRPGKVVWEGDVRPLGNGRPLVVDGHEFHTLEALFLHQSGQRDVRMAWV